MSHKSTHQIIGGIETETDLDDILADAKDLTDLDFSDRDTATLPELVDATRKVHEDLENGNAYAAFEKLTWYFNSPKSPLAHLRTEEDILDYLSGPGVSGAYAINPAKMVDAQVGLFKIYEKLKRMNLKNAEEAQKVMYV